MLCDSCKNKLICKYYECFNNAPIKLSVQVNECELYSGNSQPIMHNPDKRPAFRQPLPSRPIDADEEENDITEEERVYINIDDIDNTQKGATIVDLFMRGEDEDGKEDR